jgi:energy-coupling factor transport system ATP-binding protein
VFTGFSAQFQRGEIVAVSGKNGCGKTTLTKLLTGVLQPSEGSIRIDGSNTAEMDLFLIGRRIGYVFQNPNRQLFCDTVYNEIAYGLRNLGLSEEQIKEKAEQNLKYFDLQRYRDIYPGKLSHGEKQRLAIAAVLALGTDYLLLDEPTTGLDIRRRRELGDLLQKLRQETNCGIVFISHEAGFISRFSDREVVMTP